MAWIDGISQNELHAYRNAAEAAWGDDTRHPDYVGHPQPSAGQCYVTSRWLANKLDADVGVRDGHYVVVSPDRQHVIDLTGDQFAYTPEDISKKGIAQDDDDDIGWEPTEDQKKHRPGPIVRVSSDHPLYKGLRVKSFKTESPRVKRFALKADLALQGKLASLGKTALDYAGDAYPGQDPQLVEDRFNHDTPEPPMPEEYNFVYAAGDLHVSPIHEHQQLLEHAGLRGDHTGPLAVGKIIVGDERATWQVTTNVGLHSLVKVLKDYTKRVGWSWGGMTDNQGEPINDDFAPKRTKFIRDNDNGTSVPFIVQGKTAYCSHLSGEQIVAIRESGFKISDYPGGTNMNDRMRNDSLHEDLGEHDYGNPNATDEDQPFFPRDREGITPQGLFKCRECDRLFPNWHRYHMHLVEQDHMPKDLPLEDGKFPETNMDATIPPRLLEQNEGWEISSAAGKTIPFVYDIIKDGIFPGHPGTKTTDIQGQFTPGGIVEGEYDNGTVVIRTETNQSYSVRHLLDLWMNTPAVQGLEVKNVEMQTQAGKTYKLAANNVGGFLRTMTAADPAAHIASEALMKAGGNVYVVGGAVRDALLGKIPNDIDLMAQGLPPDTIGRILQKLPGRVDLTGKQFGVFRYRHNGNEVEIALPRREQSTGEGHKDFDVQSDHTMSPEEDMGRRDFTINAMAVDLKDGKLIDPYGGAKDIDDRVLRTVSPQSFSEDPLRVARALTAHAKHGVHPTPQTLVEMARHAPNLEHLPADRIQQELDKIMKTDNPGAAIELAHKTGVLKYMLPEVEAAWNFDQNNPHHNYPLGEHLLNVLNHVSKRSPDIDLRMAALLHDIGKPGSEWRDPQTGFSHYYRGPNGEGDNHDELGASMAYERLFNHLRYPKARATRIGELISHHMYPDFSSTKGARKFLKNVGDHADDLFTLREADRAGKGTDDYQATKTPIDAQRDYVAQVRAAGEPVSQSSLAINGNDLKELGIPQGPLFGQILRQLTDEVVENPELNNREVLLNRALQISQGGSL